MDATDRRAIVVAVPDGESESMLRYAAWEALTHGCELRLVHVHRPGEREPAQRVLAEALALAELLADPGIPVTGRLVSGAPVAAVLAAATDAHLVVVRQRDALRLVRAVAEDLSLREVPPVACVPTGWTIVRDDRRPVLVGVDDPSRSRALLSRSLEIARVHEAALHVLHAWRFPRRYDTVIDARIGDQWSGHVRSLIAATLDRCRPEHGGSPVPVEVVVQHGAAAALLVDAARNAQVLVLERNPSAAGGVHLGRTARAALHECPCPVLLLPPGHARAEALAPRDAEVVS
jgi:nucleotide-binding universal stress UspA family protein